MSQLIYKQYIYDNDNSSRNVGVETASQLSNGLDFGNAISHIGVQALPGTKFYLGNSNDPIIVGFLGYIEVDLTLLNTSYSFIRFDSTSLDVIKNNKSAILLIDTTYMAR